MSIELLNEDNMVLMSRYADKHFDLAIVDPEYGIDAGNMTMGNGKNKKYGKKSWDKSPPKIDYFTELFRVSKNQIVWGGNYFTDKLPVSRGWLVWDKMLNKDVSFADFELAWTSYDEVCKKINVQYSGFLGADIGERIHPTQKPIKLYKKLLNKYAKPGYKILDTHLGSGSIAIACHEYGFDLTACEIDKDYYDAAVNRFKMLTSQTQCQFQAS